MISFGELEDSARVLYEADSSVRWTSEDFLQSANDGLDELSEATGFYERFAPVPLMARQTYYDMRGYLPESFLGITALFNVDQQIWLDPIGYRDMLVHRWENVTGAPIAYMIRGVFWIGVYPRPDADGVMSLRVYYDGLAPHFRERSSVMSDLPDDFFPALEQYILYDLNCKDGDADKAKAHWAKYKSAEDELKKFVANRVTTARKGGLGRSVTPGRRVGS